ncbi:unnamed protein product, partial [Prorocentrum cordatum]
TQTAHWQAKGCACRLRGEGLLRDPATWCDGLRATRCFHSPWSHLDVRQSPTSASSGSAAQQEATADRFYFQKTLGGLGSSGSTVLSSAGAPRRGRLARHARGAAADGRA